MDREIDMVQCPRCRTHFAPTADGVCPACGNSLHAPPESASMENHGERRVSRAQLVGAFERALMTFTPRLLTTPAIVIANVLVFVAMVATGVHFLSPTAQSVLEWGANFGPKTMSGQWWRLVTCMFLHFGILHLGLNMWVLWDLGRLVERLVGNFGFLVLYFVSGIAGSLASLAWNPVVVSAGASGAVFGVVGALLGIMVFRSDTVPAVVLKELRNSMGAFVLYNVVFGFSIPGIDMAAHLGGLAAGFVCGLVLSQPLSPAMVSKRWLRNSALVLLGGAALPLVAIALPAAPPDIRAEMQRFVEVERRAIDTANSLLSRAQQGEINDAEFAQALERDVLPPWIEMRHRLEAVMDAPHARREVLERLTAYMKAREEAWQLRAEGLHEQDASKLERANERESAADKQAKEITSP